MLSFGELRASSIINVSGVSPKTSQFRTLVNEATQRLMRRGDWPGTIAPIFTCITNGCCLVWPRYVGTIRQLNYCGRRHVPIKNVWWDFLPYDRHFGWSSHEWWGWRGGAASMVNQTKTPVFQDVLGDGRTIRAYNESAMDDNKSIWLFGEDNNGQPLMTRGAGPWSDGIKLTLNSKGATPYATTTINVRRIDRVIKDETSGPVRLYAWNTSASVLEDVAYYEPSETHPAYLRSRLNLGCNSSSTGVVALVKLQFVPVKVDTDLVLIDNIVALKHMIQCIRSEEAGDVATARAFLTNAVDELNQELKDENPDEQIPVDLGVLGHGQDCIGNQRCF